MGARAAVVYCGGCNPEIDRAALIRSLVRNTGLIICPAAQATPEVELLIAVNGCIRRCSERTVARQFKELIVVAGFSVDGWPVAREKIEGILIKKVNEIVGLEKHL